MTVAASYIVQRVSQLLQDTSCVQWQVDELVRWLNDGQREIVMYKPDANFKVAVGTLSAGTRQDMTTMTGVSTSNPYMLIDVVRNMAGSSQLGAVRQIGRDILDRQNPTWHSDTASVDISHFIYDPRYPTQFYVYPPATTAAQLEIIFSAYPTDVSVPSPGGTYTNVTGNISVQDIYANALIDYIAYRAYAKESEEASNITRAAAYYSAFANSIGTNAKGVAADSSDVKV